MVCLWFPSKSGQHPHTPVPVVFASHGYTCSGEIYLGNSGWNRVAKQENFIVIAATGPYDYIEGKGENQASKFENTQLPAWNIFGKPDLPVKCAFFLPPAGGGEHALCSGPGVRVCHRSLLGLYDDTVSGHGPS